MIIGIIVGGLSILLGLFGVIFWINNVSYFKEKTTGKVVEIERHLTKGSDSKTYMLFYPVYEYFADGKVYREMLIQGSLVNVIIEYHSNKQYVSRIFPIGKENKLRYHLQKPEEFQVDNRIRDLIISTLLLLVGITLLKLALKGNLQFIDNMF